MKNLILEELQQNTIDNLYIFDFDGTLFDTPLPDKGKIIYQEKTGKPYPHKGWWSKPESLDMDIFDISPIPSVINDYKKVITEPNSRVVMLTGRLQKLAQYVEKILDKFNIKFDEYIYSDGNTLKNKLRYLDNAITKYKHLKKIEMWEDRLEHIPKFDEFLKSAKEKQLIDSYKIHIIESNHH